MIVELQNEEIINLSEMLYIYKGVSYQKFFACTWNIIKWIEFQISTPPPSLINIDQPALDTQV